MNDRTRFWSTFSLVRATKVAAAIVTSVGCLVLIGWILDISVLKSVLPNLVTMKVNSALGFILAGTALFASTKPKNAKKRLVGQLCSQGVIAIGSATLSQYLWGWDLGIDQLIFVDDPQPIGTLTPGRMSPLAAICFVLIGSALWLSQAKRRSPNSPSTNWGEKLTDPVGELTAGADPSPTPLFKAGRGDREGGRRDRFSEFANSVLAILTSLIASQVVVAYLYQVHPIIGFGTYTQMALHTAVCFVVLAVGILMANPDQGLIRMITADSAGGILARHLLPAAIAIPLLLGWLQITTARAGLIEAAFGTSISVVLHIIVFTTLVLSNSQQLHRIDLQKQATARALSQANDELETRIQERTAQLQAANESLNLAIEGAGMAVWDMDLQTGKGIWSAQYFKLMGYELVSSGETSIEMWRSRIYPKDLERISEIEEQAKHEHQILSYEYRITRFDNGQLRWLKSIGRFFYNQAGEAVRCRGIVFDITESKQAQEERDRFFTLSNEMIAVAGIDGYFKQLNPAWERVLGYTQAELKAQPFLSFVHPDDIEATRVAAKQFEEGNPAATFENRYRCKDGSYKWLSWKAVSSPKHNLRYASARDITEHKQAEQEILNLNLELQRQLAESQTLLEVIPIGVGIALDQKCEKIRVNSAFAQMLAISPTENASLSAPEEERPKHFKVYQNQQEVAPEDLPLQRAAADGIEVRDLEVDVVWDDGTTLTLLEYAAPLFDENGGIRGSIGAFLDITQRKLAEAELQQLNITLEQRVEERTAQLQEVNKDLEAFSYTVAHDLRAPLRAIQGFTQALVEDYGDRLDPTAQEYIQYIFDGIDRMNNLITDLLAYSRLSFEQIRLTPIKLTQVLMEAQAQLETELRDRQASITVAKDLPKVCGQHSILVQIVVNLLSNSIKFVASGVQPQICVWAQNQENWVRLWVEDNGIGIAPNYQEQIFGVFERLHTVDTYPGTGIGLAIVRKGAERLGGRAGVESVPGQGSRFWIELQGVK